MVLCLQHSWTPAHWAHMSFTTSAWPIGNHLAFHVDSQIRQQDCARAKCLTSQLQLLTSSVGSLKVGKGGLGWSHKLIVLLSQASLHQFCSLIQSLRRLQGCCEWIKWMNGHSRLTGSPQLRKRWWIERLLQRHFQHVSGLFHFDHNTAVLSEKAIILASSWRHAAISEIFSFFFHRRDPIPLWGSSSPIFSVAEIFASWCCGIVLPNKHCCCLKVDLLQVGVHGVLLPSEICAEAEVFLI